MEKIHQIPIPLNDNKDTSIWNMNSNGYFTSKSCLAIIKPTKKPQYDFMWI